MMMLVVMSRRLVEFHCYTNKLSLLDCRLYLLTVSSLDDTSCVRLPVSRDCRLSNGRSGDADRTAQCIRAYSEDSVIAVWWRQSRPVLSNV